MVNRFEYTGTIITSDWKAAEDTNYQIQKANQIMYHQISSVVVGKDVITEEVNFVY